MPAASFCRACSLLLLPPLLLMQSSAFLCHFTLGCHCQGWFGEMGLPSCHHPILNHPSQRHWALQQCVFHCEQRYIFCTIQNTHMYTPMFKQKRHKAITSHLQWRSIKHFLIPNILMSEGASHTSVMSTLSLSQGSQPYILQLDYKYSNCQLMAKVGIHYVHSWRLA